MIRYKTIKWISDVLTPLLFLSHIVSGRIGLRLNPAPYRKPSIQHLMSPPSGLKAELLSSYKHTQSNANYSASGWLQDWIYFLIGYFIFDVLHLVRVPIPWEDLLLLRISSYRSAQRSHEDHTRTGLQMMPWTLKTFALTNYINKYKRIQIYSPTDTIFKSKFI